VGFRFRRRIKLLPGVRLNISKSGVSTSVGEPGATINLRGNNVRTTVGVPSSGLSYTSSARGRVGGSAVVLVVLFILVLVFLWH
jgi:hypothetical protein